MRGRNRVAGPPSGRRHMKNTLHRRSKPKAHLERERAMHSVVESPGEVGNQCVRVPGLHRDGGGRDVAPHHTHHTHAHNRWGEPNPPSTPLPFALPFALPTPLPTPLSTSPCSTHIWSPRCTMPAGAPRAAWVPAPIAGATSGSGDAQKPPSPAALTHPSTHARVPHPSA